MAVNLHLQNLSEMAVNVDIRRLFMNWDIPEGGVRIIGGPNGDAFVEFNNEIDLLRAMALSGSVLLGQRVRLRVIGKIEMEALICMRKKELEIADQEILNHHAIASHSGGHDHTGEYAYPNPFTQVQQGDKHFYKRAYNDGEDDDNLRHGQGYGADWKCSKPSAADGVTGTTGRFDRSHSGMPDGSNYDGCYTGQQQNYSQQSVFSGRDNTSGNFGKRDPINEEPGYITVDNLGRSVAYKDVREFFRNYDLIIKKGEIVLKVDTVRGTKIAFIQFTNVQDAIIASNLRPVDIKRIHAQDYEQAKSSSDDRQQMRNSDKIRSIFNTSGTNEALSENINYQDALKADTLRHGVIHDQAIEMEMISSNQFEQQKTVAADNQESRLNEFDTRNRTAGQWSESRSVASYIQIRNVNRSVHYKELEKFFRLQNIKNIKSGDIILPSEASWESTIYVKFPTETDAILAESLNTTGLPGRNVHIQRISKWKFEDQVSGQIDQGTTRQSTGVSRSEDTRTDTRQDRKYEYSSVYPAPHPIPSPLQAQSSVGGRIYTPPGYIMLQNISSTVRHEELKAFFHVTDISIARNGIILKPSKSNNVSTAYVKFISLQDALRADSLNYRKLRADGMEVSVEMISPTTFEYQKTAIAESLNNSSISRTGQDKADSRNFADTDKPSGASNKFECFIQLDQLPGDATASEVWGWFRGPQGFSTGVRLIYCTKNAQSMVAYVAFDSAHHRNVAKIENEPCKASSAKMTYRDIAQFGKQYDVLEATVTGIDKRMDAGARTELRRKYFFEDVSRGPILFTEMNERCDAVEGDGKFLCFLLLHTVPKGATASSIKTRYDNCYQGSKGVALIRRMNGVAMFAYVAFEDVADRDAIFSNSKMRHATSTTRDMYIHFARFGTHCEIEESVGYRTHRILPKEQHDELRQTFYFDELSIFNHIASRANAEPTDIFSLYLYFLRLSGIPKDATACGMRKWFGGKIKTSKGVLLVHKVFLSTGRFAYFAFENRKDRMMALRECKDGLTLSVKDVCKEIAGFTTKHKILESTDSGEDHVIPWFARKRLQKSLLKCGDKGNSQEASKRKANENPETNVKRVKRSKASGNWNRVKETSKVVEMQKSPVKETEQDDEKYVKTTKKIKVKPTDDSVSEDREVAMETVQDDEKKVKRSRVRFSKRKRKTHKRNMLKRSLQVVEMQKSPVKETEQDAEKNVKTTEKINVKPTDDSDSDDTEVAKGKKNMIQKDSIVLELQKSPVKETEQDGEVRMEEDFLVFFESLKDDVIKEDVEDELTSTTSCTPCSTSRSFFEKPDESVDESEYNHVDDVIVLHTDED